MQSHAIVVAFLTICNRSKWFSGSSSSSSSSSSFAFAARGSR